MSANVCKTSIINHIAFFLFKRSRKKERPKCLLDLRYYKGLNLPKFWNEFRFCHIISFSGIAGRISAGPSAVAVEECFV